MVVATNECDQHHQSEFRSIQVISLAKAYLTCHIHCKQTGSGCLNPHSLHFVILSMACAVVLVLAWALRGLPYTRRDNMSLGCE